MPGVEDADAIHIRGAPVDVDRAVRDIKRIIEAAKSDEIDNNYVRNCDLLKLSLRWCFRLLNLMSFANTLGALLAPVELR